MKKILLAFMFLTAHLYCQQLQWARGFSVSGGDCMGTAVAADNSGNVYVTGSFDGTIDFDPGSGTHSLSSGSTYNALFLAKYDASGNYLWAFSVGNSSGYAAGFGITVDQGNVIIAGNFGNGPMDFDPGTGIQNLTSTGNQDAFLAKYDSNGNYVWAFNIGNVGNASQGNSVKCDTAGNIYLTGKFHGSADFDPSTNTHTLSGGGGFIAKYTSSGAFSFAFNLPGTSITADVALNSSGTIFVTGYFTGTIDFDPGTGTSNLSSPPGHYDLYLASYTSSGNYLWAFNPGCNGTDGSGGSSLRIKGNSVYLAGTFAGSGDFDPGTGVQTLTARGAMDAFLAKYSDNGTFTWIKQIGSTTTSFEKTITTAMDQNMNGDLFLTGYFDGTTDFDPGSLTNVLSASNSQYLFVARYDSSGNHTWAFDVGCNGQANDVSMAITTAGNNFYCTGFFGGSNNDFDPGSGTYNLGDSSTVNAMYLARYNAATIGIKNITSPGHIKIYPSPASDLICIDLPAENKMINFTITSSEGEIVWNGRGIYKINVSDWRPGPYIITVRCEEFVYREKLLIIH